VDDSWGLRALQFHVREKPVYVLAWHPSGRLDQTEPTSAEGEEGRVKEDEQRPYPNTYIVPHEFSHLIPHDHKLQTESFFSYFLFHGSWIIDGVKLHIYPVTDGFAWHCLAWLCLYFLLSVLVALGDAFARFWFGPLVL
jgi:hypothetical protein